MSGSNYCFLTCIQISQEAGQVIWYPHLFQNFLQFLVIHTVKGFGIVNKTEITSLQIDGEKMGTVKDFIFLDLKITAVRDCGREIKRFLLLGRKALTNLDSMLKSRDITLPINIRIIKVMVFPVVTYRCESWTIKKAEHWRIDAFELWCRRRLEYSLEALMLKLKLQGYLMQRADSLEKTVMLGKIEGRRRKGWQRTRWLDGITNSMDTSLSKLWEWWRTGKPGVLQSMGSQSVEHDLATKQRG